MDIMAITKKIGIDAMMSEEKLKRCLDILSELYSNVNGNKNHNLILELGYIINSEIKTIKDKPKTDVDKLIEDNTQLFKEKESLLNIIRRLNNIINNKIPSVENSLETIEDKFNTINKYLQFN